MKLPFLFCSYALLFISLCNANRCPEPDDLKPHCTCSLSFTLYNLMLILPTTVCREVYQLQALKEVFSDIGDRPLVHLEVTNSLINFFPASALKKKNVRMLHFTGSTMVSLFETDPEENNKLFDISINKSTILRGMQWSHFRNLHNLSRLYTDGVTMKRLGKDFVENIPTSLRTIMMHNTNLRTMHDEVFSTLSKLDQIEMGGGRLTTLKRSMFPKQNQITRLRFVNHKIGNLPDDIFSDMPRLNYVSLSGNQITLLSESVFKVLADRNADVHLLPSPIVCDCSMLWVVSRTNWNLHANCEAPQELRFRDIKSLGPNWGCRATTA